MRWQIALIGAAVLIFIVNAAPFTVPSKAKRPQVIYGADDRRDYYQVDDPNLLVLADSTVALILNTRLETQGETTRILTAPYGASKNLCSSEPFYDQEIAANCTGFLVGPDLIATAGHCISTQTACDRTKFVFGFRITQEGMNPRSVPTSEVYSCKEIIRSVVEPYGHDPNDGEDFAVIRLDRVAAGHAPLNLRLQGEPQVGEDLIVMGHPAMLPLKIAGGANIRSTVNKYFVANMDTYGGNSGSPVFNEKTLEVEGILVRGEADWVMRNGCMVSNQCADNACRGEDATKIKQILPYLQAKQF